ncbi:antibiotic biosynthesis monooxygenase [Geodermatophilus normandii]|uniref:Antibiotic biosynthesis monooxygenase n=1 Tax=Geodermatophilus normandii TaxID=1137989 RepID=A0A317QLL9_9ACTN|nr:antibiotic biosynthesis monooxygenase family protein [Geodermatophilus normandii]PWW24262.1 antibiotic biosynthesis monooxygenase [Geodermatophilus normandii]
MFLRIWTYGVLPDALNRFVAAYGPDGEWARLFARADGFLGTELFRDAGGGTRFVTVDRWRDEADWTAFLARWAQDYRTLDGRLAPLTGGQALLFEGASPGR